MGGSTTPNVFSQLLQYTIWANDTLFSLFEKYGERLPASSLRLMNHIVNTQFVWVDRINGSPVRFTPWDDHDLGTCKTLNAGALQEISTAIDREGDNLERTVAYKNFSGNDWESSLFDMFLQTFNHGTYHRAQIAQDLRRNGLEPVNTDYITFVRAVR